MDASTRKEILDRILSLNQRTLAVKEVPHRIDIAEVEKREKRVKVLHLIFIVLTGLYFLTVSIVVALPGSPLEIYLNEHKSLWILILLILVMKTMNLNVKKSLISEQKFLVNLLNKSIPQTND